MCVCVWGLLTVEEGESMTLLPALETPFLLLAWLVQLQYEGFHIVLWYLALSCLAVVSWTPVLKRKQMGTVDLVGVV